MPIEGTWESPARYCCAGPGFELREKDYKGRPPIEEAQGGGA